MAGYVILGALAAFGAFSALWAMLGWLLPGAKGGALVYWGKPSEAFFICYRWLRGIGFLQCPLLVVLEEEPKWQFCREIEICSPGQLLSRLEWERNQFDGTGNGDPSGHDQCCGISEL